MNALLFIAAYIIIGTTVSGIFCKVKHEDSKDFFVVILLGWPFVLIMITIFDGLSWIVGKLFKIKWKGN